MRDVVYGAITLGFFGLAALFVIGCARIVGPDGPGLDRDDDVADRSDEPQEAAAMAGSVTS